MSSSRWPLHLGWIALLAARSGAAAPSPQQVHAELDRLSGDVAVLGNKLGGLEATYLSPETIAGVASYSNRLADAEILFLLGDYTRAIWILYDLAGDAENRHETLYPKALYYLGEALVAVGHDFSARDVFMELLNTGAHEHQADAVRRLIQIADRSQHWKGLEDQIAVLSRQGPLPADVAYIYAKSLLHQGRFDAVGPALASISQDHALHPKAQYLSAVAKLQSGDLDVARELFAGLKQVSDHGDDAAQIRDLAAMSQARILLEQGKTAEAIDAYQFIGRSSPLFEQALYEISWTFVRAASQAADQIQRDGEYKQAQKTLEVLLLGDAQTPVMSEASLLLGNIYLRLGQFEQAEATFRGVVRALGPTRDQLAQLISPSAAFGPTLYARVIATHGVDLVPGLPVAWTEDEQDLQRGLDVENNIDLSGTWMKDATSLAGSLLDVLSSPRRSLFFPALNEARGRTNEYEIQLLKTTESLLDLQRGLEEGVLDPPAVKQLADLARQRKELAPLYQAALNVRTSAGGPVGEQLRGIGEVEQQLLRLQFDLNGMRAQLNGLVVWLRDHPQELNATDAADFRQRQQLQEAVVTELEKAEIELATEVRHEHDLAAANDGARAAQNLGSLPYQVTLEVERDVLETARKRMTGEQPDAMGAIDALWESMAARESTLQQFSAKLDRAVAEHAAAVRAEVLRQQGQLAQYAQELEAVRDQAQLVVAQVAVGSVADVHKRFRDIVLRADVGIVDVAWALKEVETREISTRINDQHRELQVLDNEYSEVVEGP